jgi:hypothetical protein
LSLESQTEVIFLLKEFRERVSGCQEFKDEPFVFGAQHRSNSHLPKHGARFAGRQVLRRAVATSTIGAESLFALLGFVYFGRSLWNRIRLLGPGAASQRSEQRKNQQRKAKRPDS